MMADCYCACQLWGGGSSGPTGSLAEAAESEAAMGSKAPEDASEGGMLARTIDKVLAAHAWILACVNVSSDRAAEHD